MLAKEMIDLLQEEYENMQVEEWEQKQNEIEVPNKSKRLLRRKNKIKKTMQLIEQIKNGSRYPSLWMDVKGRIRRKHSSVLSTYGKRIAHRTVRRYKNGLSDGKMSNRLFDYAWYLY